jgi:flagellar hook-basal body complex protein FliE
VSALQPISSAGASAVHALAADDLAPGDFASIPAVGEPAGSSFGKLMVQGIADVNEKLKAGEIGLQQLATGEVQNLHQVMIRLEESRLSFQLMMQVRNRLLEAYQDVMKMQV